MKYYRPVNFSQVSIDEAVTEDVSEELRKPHEREIMQIRSLDGLVI